MSPRDFLVGTGAVADAQPHVNVPPDGSYFFISYTQDAGGGTTTIHEEHFEIAANGTPTGALLAGLGLGGNAEIVEDSDTGAIVGSLSALDPDLSGSHTFTLLNNAGGRFALANGVIKVANGVAIDFEQALTHSYNIVVRVTDEAGAHFDQTLTIDVLDSVVDNVDGTAGNDVIFGGANADRLFGLAGNDDLRGGAGNDVLSGGAGNDVLRDGLGNDYMAGGAGNDVYTVGQAGDRVVESAGAGADQVVSTITYTLSLNVENLTLFGAGAINGTGNGGINTIVGNTGGNVINGRAGSDILTGGAGADTFVFNSALGATNVDTITDYNAVADTIQLDDAVFTALVAGALDAAAFRDGTRALDASDRIIYDTTNGALLYDADGNGAGLAVRFATLSTGLTLSEADLFVI